MEKIIRNEDGTVTIDGQVYEPRKEKSWPEYCGRYYLIDANGCIGEDSYMKHPTDKARMEIGNAFKTKEEAETVLQLLKIRAKIKQWQEENDPEEKDRAWDCRLYHYPIVLSLKNLTLDVGNNCAYKCNIFYFSTRDKAQECIDTFKDDLIWYFQNC